MGHCVILHKLFMEGTFKLKHSKCLYILWGAKVAEVWVIFCELNSKFSE